MGQNKKYNNNSKIREEEAGQTVGQRVGQRDSLKEKALSCLTSSDTLSQGLSQGGGTGSTPASRGKTPSVPLVPHTGDWDSGTKFNALLQEVGGKVFMENGKPVLRFNPPLEREEANPERWAQALKLESLFWKLCEEHGY